MDKGELVSLAVATALMTIVFTLLIYYVMPMPFEYALVAGFVVTLCTVMFHESVHMLYAEEVCHRNATFTLTKFALGVTLTSIAVLTILILIKQYTGWYTYVIPIIASPGGVYILMKDLDRCYDNIAIVAPFANMIVGILCLFYLFTTTNPPFILNDVSNFTQSLVALVAFFSFSLAFINALPIRVGNVATDGYWAVTVDQSDYVTKMLAVITVAVSFYVLFLSGWWCIKVVT